MNRFTIARQKTTMESVKPRVWGWLYLFRVLVEIQHNQQEQIRLLRQLNSKRPDATVTTATSPDLSQTAPVENAPVSPTEEQDK